jgi:hypothetical protein
MESECIEQVRAVRWVERNALPGLIRRNVMHASVALDIGCGIRPQTLVWPDFHICVEIHDEYVKYLQERCSASPRYLVLHSSWKDALRIMPSRSVDTVFALDFIEHLTKGEGFDFLAQAERVARRQVILYTPLGYFPQSYEAPDETDRWGMHGGYWQTHRSGWTPEDFPAGWEIIACRDYHTHDRHGHLDAPIGCLWAIRTLPQPPVNVSAAVGRWEWHLWRQTMVHLHTPARCRRVLRAIRARFHLAGYGRV